ncbi:MAG: NAD(P)H-binding protein [Psychroflexus sp.]
MIKEQISILGCGWLGLEFAKNLLTENYIVKGSTTSENKIHELKKTGIQPFEIQLFEDEIQGKISEFLKGSSVLLINIPPGLRKQPELDYVAKMQNLIEAITQSKIQKVIYISSTSIFNDTKNFPTYLENYEFSSSEIQNNQLIQVEENFRNQQNFKTTIVRFGGLVGGDRHPVKYLAGRKAIQNPLAPVNLIHRNNCIKLLKAILEQQAFGDVFHGVENIQANKAVFYKYAAMEFNLETPQFDTTRESIGKKIDTKTTRMKLNIEFKNLV